MGKKKLPAQAIEEVRHMCEDYLNAMERIDKNGQRIKELKAELKNDIPDYAETLFNREIEKLKVQIQKDTEDTGYVRWAIAHLDKRDRSVMEQLYVEGYAWNSIIDETGRTLSSGSIDKTRRRCFSKMAELIDWMRKDIREENKRCSHSREGSKINDTDMAVNVEEPPPNVTREALKVNGIPPKASGMPPTSNGAPSKANNAASKEKSLIKGDEPLIKRGDPVIKGNGPPLKMGKGK